MTETQARMEDVEADRRRIRAALIAGIRLRRVLAKRRLMRLVRLSHVGRPW